MKRNPWTIGIAGLAVIICALLLARMSTQRPLRDVKPNPAGQSAPGMNQRGAPSKPAAVTSDSRAAKASLTNQVTPEGDSKSATSAAPVTTLSLKAAVATAPEFTALPPETVMENVRSVFRLYRSQFGGNPVGTNLEITRALNGGNAKQAVFVNPEDGLRVNEKGEMVDPWGTPFFFHQLSGTEMEIHSAGPDRVMWTADDLVTK